MRRGFTILELLVASLLLGMLVTILTMIFNQSSIAWRTGVAGVSDLDLVRDNMAELRDEADNIYVWQNSPHRLLSLWDDTDTLRTRAIDADGGKYQQNETAQLLKSKCKFTDDMKLDKIQIIKLDSDAKPVAVDTYIVNVKSAGPDREFGTWDDIWSFPDDFN